MANQDRFNLSQLSELMTYTKNWITGNKAKITQYIHGTIDESIIGILGELDTKISGSTSDLTYKTSGDTVIAVGGIDAGTNLSGKTYSEIFDDMFFPELFPTDLTLGGLQSFTSTVTGLRIIGETAGTITFTATFSQGNILPQYQSASNKRSGLPNKYNYTGTGLPSSVSSIALTNIQSISNYVVLSGANNWTATVTYDAGVQPKGSKGTNVNSPQSSGTTASRTVTITGVYPYYCTTNNITTLTQQSLIGGVKVITIDVVAETDTDKQKIEVPAYVGLMTLVEQYNTLGNNWDTLSPSLFTKTDTTKTINSVIVNYYLYAHNSVKTGARKLRFTFTNNF